MRKVLVFFAALGCISSLAFANNDPTKLYYKTYSVEAQPYTTNYMTFEPYHAVIQLENLTRVSENGDFRVVLEYLKGIEVGQEKVASSFAGSYYSVPIMTPVYQAKVYDKANNLVLEKKYGGNNSLVEFGKNQQLDDVQIVSEWANKKAVFLQATEFQQLNFQPLEVDLKELVGTLEAAAPTLELAQEETITEIEVFEDTPSVEDIFEEPTDKSSDGFYQEPSEELTMEEKILAVEETTPTKALTTDRRNIVKLNLPNLAYKNITLNYERILSNRTSASIHAGYIIPSAAPSFVTNALGIDSTALVGTDSTSLNQFSGFTVTGEYRIYGKKKGAARGFYYAPYLRYANYKYLFAASISKNFSNIDARLSTFGLGAQLGYQWVIKDRFVIDWGILGASIQRYNLSSTFSSKDDMVNFQEIRKELEAEIKDNSLLSGTIEFTEGNGFLDAKLPFLFGGLRSYISVGMQF